MQCRECYLHVREDFDVSPNYILEDHQCDWDQFPMFTSQVQFFLLHSIYVRFTHINPSLIRKLSSQDLNLHQ